MAKVAVTAARARGKFTHISIYLQVQGNKHLRLFCLFCSVYIAFLI